MRGLADGWRMAIGTLTIIPSGTFDGSRAAARWAMALAPLAVVPLGLAATGMLWLGGLVGAPPLLVGLAVTAALVLGTRGMHVDGLADTVDGLGGGWTPERARQIMLRGDVGPMGAVWLALSLGAQTIGWSRVAELPSGWALAVVLVPVSRAALTIPCLESVPAMPGDDLGHVVARSIPRPLAAAWWVAAVALAGAACWVAGLSPWHGAVAVVVAYAGVALLVRRCVRVFEGVNGDVMGASIEVALTLLLVVVACR